MECTNLFFKARVQAIIKVRRGNVLGSDQRPEHEDKSAGGFEMSEKESHSRGGKVRF
jgi:hypothetical protein